MEELVPCQEGHTISFNSSVTDDYPPPGDYDCAICGQIITVEEEEEWEPA